MFTDGLKNAGNFAKNNAGAIGGIGMAAATGNIGGAIQGGMNLAQNHKVILLEDLNMFTDGIKKAGNFAKNNAGAIGGIGMAAATGNVGGAVAGGVNLAQNHKVLLLI